MLSAGAPSFATLPGIIYAILMISTAVAAAIAVIRSTLIKTQLDNATRAVEALRGDRDDLIIRVAEAEKETAKVKSELAIETSRRVALELSVSGKKELQRIISTLDSHAQRAARIEQKINDLLNRTERGGV